MTHASPEKASIFDAVQFQYMSGCYYLHGDKKRSQNPDFDKARHCFIAAANAGHGHAAYSLGLMAFNGHGRDHDPVCGLKWMMIAKALDANISLATLGDLLPEMCDDLRERAQCAASLWLVNHLKT